MEPSKRCRPTPTGSRRLHRSQSALEQQLRDDPSHRAGHRAFLDHHLPGNACDVEQYLPANDGCDVARRGFGKHRSALALTDFAILSVDADEITEPPVAVPEPSSLMLADTKASVSGN